MRPQLVFIHGIGGPRDPARELARWTSALASGMRDAGHARLGRELTAGSGVECVFAHYADLFGRGQSQGEPDGLPDEAEAEVLSDLLVAWVDALAAEDVSERDRRLLEHARAEAAPRGQTQGSLEVVRRAINVATTVLSLKPWGDAAQWITPKLMVRQLAQVARYLARGEDDEEGVGLDRRVRARVADVLGAGPVVVVAHSLGTVVALEALHERPSDIRLLVTLGSPIAMRTVVWPRLVPQPPSVPETVAEWLNFWDRDDIIAVRPHLERDVGANRAGVVPVSSRIDSDGVWVHSADKYLAQPAVAGRVAEALMSMVSEPSGNSE
ncbi:hypothetical protein HRW14_15870 [Streptomyces lunaelactis]|nr:hypothetical protein [Streptomyces lunaelactis]NUK68037.1 hypothetical protein [Streptomyces lunaelactis]